MKHTIVVEGELIDEHTIRIEHPLKGVLGKVKMILELPGQMDSSESDEFEKHFIDIGIDLAGYKFDREEANER
ncbi:MAG: hypothetical protein RBT69_09195 [Spirochaetia bacterium]|jgi:hypothetical protein|nr:hypothetical protein [Spirochaetia bacterium]